MKTFLRVLACLGLWYTVQAQDCEYKYLDAVTNPVNWHPEEATALQAETKLDEHPVLCFHIDVDFHAGEAKYPIGWPRMYMNVNGKDRDWSDYDRVEFQIMTKSSREQLPNSPLFARIFGENGKIIHLDFVGKLKLNEWRTISLSTDQLPDPQHVSRLAFNISESNYNDKDMVEFYIGGYRLVRSKDCKVAKLAVGDAVLYAETQVLPVSLEVLGPGSALSRGIPFELKQGDKILRRETLPARKGNQQLLMDVAELRLAPGTYTLTAFPGDEAKRVSANVRIIESPWQEVKP